MQHRDQVLNRYSTVNRRVNQRSRDGIQGTQEDINLVNKAVREGWLVTEEHRKNALQMVNRIIANEDNNYSPQQQIKAAELLVKMDKVNLEAEKISKREQGVTYQQVVQLFAGELPEEKMYELAEKIGLIGKSE